jgi:hypothetical protein
MTRAFDAMRPPSRKGGGERSDVANHRVGTPCAIRTHDRDIHGREIRRRG